MLYLHEIIDIVGTGQEAYLKTVIERWGHSEKLAISRLVGTWKVIGSTNRWPRVVNLWEMEGWEHWVDSLERQFLPEKKDTALAPWWAKATEWRSGGFDRILEPASYSPTLAGLREERLRAWVCVHAIVRTVRGQRSAFLSAVGETLRPLLARHQLSLVGAYAAPMMSDEAVVIWAAPDFRHLCGLYAARRDNAEWQAWRRQAASLLERHETMWLVPAEGSLLHPEYQK